MQKLAGTTVALLVVVFVTVNATVLFLRCDPVEHEHFTVPSVVPVLGVGVSVALMTQIDLEVWGRAALSLP